jgi:hypothetical protein
LILADITREVSLKNQLHFDLIASKTEQINYRTILI